MTILQRRLYASIIRLHPTSFRNHFGREMLLDFEDARTTDGFAPLCLDALLSLARQWTASAFSPTTEHLPPRKLSLLAGDYVAISPGGPSPFNIARASILATLLLFAICFALSTSSRRTPINLPVGSRSQAKGIHSPAQHPIYSADMTNSTHTAHRTGTTEVLGPTGRLRAHGSAFDEAEGSSRRSIGTSIIDPELKKYLWQITAFFELVWLMALLLYKCPSIGRKVAIALFALTAFAAPLAFASVPAAAQDAQAQPKPELLLFHPPAPLAYEVATVKPLDPEAAAGMVRLPPGASLSPLSVRRYIMDAYGATYSEQIIGGREWLNKDAFLIHGKVPDDLEAALQNMPYQQRLEKTRALQQSLLANRFHLTAHFETRILPVYELVPAKSGLKITEVPAPPEHKPSHQPTPPRPGDKLPPGTSMSTFSSNGLHVLNARAIKLDQLARVVGVDVGDRPIVNHTGFTGCFDITGLTWAPLNEAVADGTLDAPSLSVAMERTLGIRIVPAKAPIEVLVIDRIDKPSEN